MATPDYAGKALQNGKNGQDDIWRQRMEGLKETLNGVCDLLKEPEETPRQHTLWQLLDCLESFAEAQFGHVLKRMPPSPKFPREYGLAVTVGQIGYDLEVIERAVHQRMFNGPKDMLKTLKIADWLAYQALLPAKGSLLEGENLTVVTYFQKSPSIRVVPYAPVALVGIPFSCLKTRQDFMAIPHEIGHYVYWYGADPESSLHIYNALPAQLAEQFEDSYAELLQKRGGWLEEIFADMYGCYVAGPTIALDFQDLQLNASQAEFFKGRPDDQEHPTPVLRPEIYTRALEKMDLNAWADRLSGQWQRRIRDRMSDGATETAINGALKDIDKIAQAAHSLLKNVDTEGNWWREVYEQVTATAIVEPTLLYDSLDAEIGKLYTNPAALSQPPEFTSEDCRTEAVVLRGLAIEEYKKVREVHRLASADKEYNDYEADDWDWVAEISLGGWTTEGPDTHWP